MCRISQRPPRVRLLANYATPALLDEHFELQVTLENQEQETIDAILHVEIKDPAGQGNLTKLVSWRLLDF